MSRPLRLAGAAHSKNETEAVKRSASAAKETEEMLMCRVVDVDEEEEWIRSVKSQLINVVRYGVSS